MIDKVKFSAIIYVMQKEELYKRIKIAGLVSYIPLVLFTWPFAGYFLGEYLEQKSGSGRFILPICIGIGLVVSITEVIRIIKVIRRWSD